MCFHWFGVEFFNSHSSLLNYIRIAVPGKNAWEALDYIPIVLLIAMAAALSVVGARLANAIHGSPLRANAVVAILGTVSTLLILFRIVEPPSFGSLTDTFGTVPIEGTVQFPIFLALLAAAGIAFGGGWAAREEGFSFSDPGRHALPEMKVKT